MHLVAEAAGRPARGKERGFRMQAAIFADLALVLWTAEYFGPCQVGEKLSLGCITVVGCQAAGEWLSPARDHCHPVLVIVPIQLHCHTDLAKIVKALRFLRSNLALSEARQEHAREDRDDADHHEKLDQSEGRGRLNWRKLRLVDGPRGLAAADKHNSGLLDA